jgi:hypothetical protein
MFKPAIEEGIASVTNALERVGARGRRGAARVGALLTTLADEPAAESALEVLVARARSEALELGSARRRATGSSGRRGDA